MPRVEVELTDIDTWVDLGLGLMTVTVKRAPFESNGGMLSINTTNSDSGAQELAPGVINQRQISNTEQSDNFWAKASGPGWILIVDT